MKELLPARILNLRSFCLQQCRRALLGAGFWLAVVSAAHAGPTLTVASSVTVPEGSTSNLTFSVSDSVWAYYAVTVTAQSSNTNLVAKTGLVLSGAGPSRILAITPKAHQIGSATITLIASNPDNVTSTNTIALTVPFVNQPPVFTQTIADRTNNENSGAFVFNFRVSDFETPAASLVATATSGNTALVPNGNLVLGGTGTNRTLTVTPAANQKWKRPHLSGPGGRKQRFQDQQFFVYRQAGQSAADLYAFHEPDCRA